MISTFLYTVFILLFECTHVSTVHPSNQPAASNTEPFRLTMPINLPINIFELLEQPIKCSLKLKDVYAPLVKKFHTWHENVFYYNTNKNQKEMFLSARILTASLPLAIIGVMMYTSPQIITYLWHMNYAPIASAPFSIAPNITPELVAAGIGKLSSFNQNCIIIGLEKGLQWLIGRKIAPDVCINPATWFTDKTNHNFINILTSMILIIIAWIYVLYYVYTDSTMRARSLLNIIGMQIIIRYALYLASFQNTIDTVGFKENIENTSQNCVLIQKDVQKLTHVIEKMLKQLISVIENQHIELKKD